MRVYKPAKSQRLLALYIHSCLSSFPPSCLCCTLPPCRTSGQLQLSTCCLSQCAHRYKLERSEWGKVVTGSCIRWQPSVQQHQAHSVGEDSWMAVKIITSNRKDSSENQKPFERKWGRSRLSYRQIVQQGSGCSKPTTACLYIPASSFIWVTGLSSSGYRTRQKEWGLQIALSWIWMTQASLQALWCSARSFPSMSYLRRSGFRHSTRKM